MRHLNRPPGFLVAATLGTAILLGPMTAVPAAAQEPAEPAETEEPSGTAEPSETEEIGETGAGPEAQEEKERAAPAPERAAEAVSRGPAVRVGRNAEPSAVQACFARWDRCNDTVRESFHAMWREHQERREGCDDTLAVAETDCPERRRPKWCVRRARNKWEECGHDVDAEQRRKHTQLEKQWEACARAYQNCVAPEVRPRKWPRAGLD